MSEFGKEVRRQAHAEGQSAFVVIGDVDPKTAQAFWYINPIIQKIEAAIKRAAQLGPEAFDHHEGVGLHQDRLEIAALVEAALVGAERYRVLRAAMHNMPHEEFQNFLADRLGIPWDEIVALDLDKACDHLRATEGPAQR